MQFWQQESCIKVCPVSVIMQDYTFYSLATNVLLLATNGNHICHQARKEETNKRIQVLKNVKAGTCPTFFLTHINYYKPGTVLVNFESLFVKISLHPHLAISPVMIKAHNGVPLLHSAIQLSTSGYMD